MGFYQRNNEGGGGGQSRNSGGGFGFGGGFNDGFGSSGGYGNNNNNNYSSSGGFFPGESGAGPSNTSMNAGGGDAKTARSTEVVPVTIAEIKKATSVQDKLRIGNVEVGRITLVAQVRDYKKGSAFTSYVLDDRSGATIEAKTWQSNEGSQQEQEANVGQYVRIFGQIRSVGGDVSISVFGIQPTSDPSEITMHMLDVIYAHAILNQQGTNGGSGYQGAAAVPAAGFANGGNAAGALGGGFEQYGEDMGGGGAPQGLTGCPLDVYNYIQTESYNTGDVGADAKAMIADPRLKHWSRKQITDAMGMLSNEGHIYTTTDDDHYKTVAVDE